MRQLSLFRASVFKAILFFTALAVLYFLTAVERTTSNSSELEEQQQLLQVGRLGRQPLNDSSSKLKVLDSFRLNSSAIKNASTKELIHILHIFTRVSEVRHLKEKFLTCVTSLFKYSSAPLQLHVITDSSSRDSAKQIFNEAASASPVEVHVNLYHVEDVVEPIRGLISYMQPHFTSKVGAYYSDALFFLSIGLHHVFLLPKIIILDVDVQLASDISKLHAHFDHFKPSAVIGLAWEQQPVYRHLLHEFRRAHPSTKMGSPPPDGHPGFNSGVMLLYLERMRLSELYENVTSYETVERMTKYYKFKGHLGDQDFYTLISFDYEELFHVLPCTWNRQLCKWWKHHGYEDVFDEYHQCNDTIHIYHGNCNTPVTVT